MVENKVRKTKKATKVVKPTTIVEEPVLKKEVSEPTPKVTSYLVPVLFKREPNDKDIPIADIFYRKDANVIELQCHRPNYHSELEMIVAGDISVPTSSGAVTMVSKSESPISWITNLHKSREFSGNPFIANEAQEIYEA